MLCAIGCILYSSDAKIAATRNNRPLIYADELSDAALKNGMIITKGNDGDNSSNDLECQSHLEFEPTAIVNNSVNVITGTYMDSEVDYSIPGAESFSFQRSYISAPTHEKGLWGKGGAEIILVC